MFLIQGLGKTNGWVQWCVLAILAVQESTNKRIEVHTGLGIQVTNIKRAGREAQVVEGLLENIRPCVQTLVPPKKSRPPASNAFAMQNPLMAIARPHLR
jgi:hypothetical protein